MYERDEPVSFEFDSFHVDILRRQLFCNGAPVQLTSKAFDTLTALLHARGQTVSKADLMNIVWPETAVEENNLTQHISALRRAFGERAGENKFIVTVPGRGYCFVAQVSAATEISGAKKTGHPDQDRWRNDLLVKMFDSSSVFGYGLASIYVLLIALPSFFFHPQINGRAGAPRSVAILDFRSAGIGDELLGMGIRDTLRAKLGSLEDVTIRPVTSDLSDADAIDAGRRMNVDVVVTGSIQRDADRVRVSVEMVDISNERILWGDIFDNRFSNAFELQDSIAIAVVTALKRPRLNGALVDPKWPFVVWKAADIPPRTIRRMMTVSVSDLC